MRIPTKKGPNLFSQLKLMYLVSPALPIGAYAYSQGLEYAVDTGWVKNTDDLSEWLSGILEHSLKYNDLPLLAAIYSAYQNKELRRVNELNRFCRACRETKELLLEDEQLGLALLKILETHDLPSAHLSLEDKPSIVTSFAFAGVDWNIPMSDLLQGFCWSWLENQVAAATKAIPLGQTQAQRVLMALMQAIPAIVASALKLEESEWGASLPGLAMSSGLHEQQYSRLFRS